MPDISHSSGLNWVPFVSWHIVSTGIPFKCLRTILKASPIFLYCAVNSGCMLVRVQTNVWVCVHVDCTEEINRRLVLIKLIHLFDSIRCWRLCSIPALGTMLRGIFTWLSIRFEWLSGLLKIGWKCNRLLKTAFWSICDNHRLAGMFRWLSWRDDHDEAEWKKPDSLSINRIESKWSKIPFSNIINIENWYMKQVPHDSAPPFIIFILLTLK